MKIVIDWELSTDGDFYLNHYEKYGIWVCMNHVFMGQKTFEGEDDCECLRNARYYLESLLCDIRVLPHHYYVLKDLYEFFDSLIGFISINHVPGIITKTMDGNYSDTVITVEIWK